MKKAFAAVLFAYAVLMLSLSFDGILQAANVYIGQLTADTSPTSDDLIETEDDPGGTPASKKVTLADAITKAHGLVTGPVVINASNQMATLSDPGGDRLLGWDESGNLMAWFSLGTGLSMSASPSLDLDATIAAFSALTITEGSLLYGTGTDAFSVLAKGTAGQLLTMNAGATAPAWASSLNGITIGGTTPAAGTFTTLSAGADGFTVDADGDAVAKSVSTTRVAGTPSYSQYYEDSNNGNEKVTVTAPSSLTADYTVTWPAQTGTLATTADLTNSTANWLTTGTISGKVPTVTNSSTSAYSVTTSQMQSGTLFLTTNAATTTYTLPAAEAGMSGCFRMGQGVAQILRIDTDGSDYIVKTTGARTSAAGDYYGATASAANQICVAAFNTTDWYVISEVGTWTEE